MCRDNNRATRQLFVSNVPILVTMLAILIALPGCVARYYPEQTDRVSIAENYAVLETENYTFAITARAWPREPQKINEYFTSFHVIVMNTTGSTMSVSPEDIHLLDQYNNQFDAKSLEQVTEVLYFRDYEHTRFSPASERFEQLTSDRMLARANLVQQSFHYGDILSGARKSGYIFFNRIHPRNENFTIIFRDERIVFVKR